MGDIPSPESKGAKAVPMVFYSGVVDKRDTDGFDPSEVGAVPIAAASRQ